MKNKIVVTFPESQMLENKAGFFDNVELINSDKGLEMYGGGAYLVNEDWYNKVKNGEVAEQEYTEKDMMYGLTINWIFPYPNTDEILEQSENFSA
jgi:hypothetical protein